MSDEAKVMYIVESLKEASADIVEMVFQIMLYVQSGYE